MGCAKDDEGNATPNGIHAQLIHNRGRHISRRFPIQLAGPWATFWGDLREEPDKAARLEASSRQVALKSGAPRVHSLAS